MADPRDILREAGVECAEVEEFWGFDWTKDSYGWFIEEQVSPMAIALARIISQLSSDKSDCQEAAQRANEAAALANADNERLREALWTALGKPDIPQEIP